MKLNLAGSMQWGRYFGSAGATEKLNDMVLKDGEYLVAAGYS